MGVDHETRIYRRLARARVAMATPILLPSSSCPCSLPCSPEWPPSPWSCPWQPTASGLTKDIFGQTLLSRIFLTCFGVDRCCRRDDPDQFYSRSSPPTVPSLTENYWKRITRLLLLLLVNPTWYWSFSSSRSSFITSSSDRSFSTRACSSAYCTLFNFSCNKQPELHFFHDKNVKFCSALHN